MTVYVARVPVGPHLAPGDADFVKLGKTPLEVQLPPGSYQIEVEGHDVSHEKLLFEMHQEPRRLLVRTGSEGMGVVGTLMLGIGITAVVGATAILVSGSKAGKLDKPAIVIPMYAAGGALTALGIGLSIAADTDIEEQKAAPVRRPSGLSFSASLRF